MPEHLDPPSEIAWLIAHGRSLLQSPSDGEPADGHPHLATWQNELLRRQVGYRWRSRHRFPEPERWLWTDVSLAQASDYWSAKYKAGLFPVGASVVDACCGAGADLVALAGRGPVLGIDADPALAALAQDNARAHGFDVRVHALRVPCELPENWSPQASWLSIDPDRRPDGQRTTDAQAFSPALDQVLQMAQQYRGGVIKLAPSTRIDERLTTLVEANCGRMWLGNQGECRQLLLLTGELRQFTPQLPTAQQPMGDSLWVGAGQVRTAVLCEPALPGERSQGTNHIYQANAPSSTAFEVPSADFGRYVYELHPTLHAADLHRPWSATHGLRPISESHGYYTSDTLVCSPWVQVFEQMAVLAWDDRKIRKWLRGAGAGQVEVKVRGVYPLKLQVDANACQRRYSRSDGKPVTLLVTRIGDRLRGIAARRLPTIDGATG